MHLLACFSLFLFLLLFNLIESFLKDQIYNATNTRHSLYNNCIWVVLLKRFKKQGSGSEFVFCPLFHVKATSNTFIKIASCYFDNNE